MGPLTLDGTPSDNCGMLYLSACSQLLDVDLSNLLDGWNVSIPLASPHASLAKNYVEDESRSVPVHPHG